MYVHQPFLSIRHSKAQRELKLTYYSPKEIDAGDLNWDCQIHPHGTLYFSTEQVRLSQTVPAHLLTCSGHMEGSGYGDKHGSNHCVYRCRRTQAVQF